MQIVACLLDSLLAKKLKKASVLTRRNSSTIQYHGCMSFDVFATFPIKDVCYEACLILSRRATKRKRKRKENISQNGELNHWAH